MAVVNVPTGFENFGADMGRLGQALALTLFPGTIRDMETEALIRQRPDIGMAMAQAVRQGGPEALQAAGVSPRLAQQIGSMFPATIDEQVQTALLNDPAFIQRATEAAALQPDVALAQGRAGIASADFQTETLDHLTRQDIPRLQAMVNAGQLRQAGERIAAVDRFGLIEKQALTELLGLDAQSAQYDSQIKALEDYHAFTKTLPPHLQGIAAAGMVNPNLASHILSHEQMGLEERLMRLRLAGQSGEPALTFMEAWKVQGDLRDRINDAIDRLRAANEEGSEQDRIAATADLQNLAGVNRTLIEQGIIPPGSVISAEMKTRLIRSGVGELFTEEPQFNMNWIREGLERHQRFIEDGTYARQIEQGIIDAIPDPVTQLQRSPGWHYLSRANQQKILADIAAGREPTLIGAEDQQTANGENASSQPSAAPPARQLSSQIDAEVTLARQQAEALDVDGVPGHIRQQAKRIKAGTASPASFQRAIQDVLRDAAQARAELASLGDLSGRRLNSAQQARVDRLRQRVNTGDLLRQQLGGLANVNP